MRRVPSRHQIPKHLIHLIKLTKKYCTQVDKMAEMQAKIGELENRILGLEARRAPGKLPLFTSRHITSCFIMGGELIFTSFYRFDYALHSSSVLLSSFFTVILPFSYLLPSCMISF